MGGQISRSVPEYLGSSRSAAVPVLYGVGSSGAVAAPIAGSLFTTAASSSALALAYRPAVSRGSECLARVIACFKSAPLRMTAEMKQFRRAWESRCSSPSAVVTVYGMPAARARRNTNRQASNTRRTRASFQRTYSSPQWPGKWAENHYAADLMRHDRAEWLTEAKTDSERAAREATDFLCYEDATGGKADFHNLRQKSSSPSW